MLKSISFHDIRQKAVVALDNRVRAITAGLGLNELRNVLRGTRFESEVPSGDARVRIYQFRSDDAPPRRVYAVWCPTSDQTQANGFSLDVPNASAATLIILEPGSATGRKMPVAVENGKVAVNVSERPIFVGIP